MSYVRGTVKILLVFLVYNNSYIPEIHAICYHWKTVTFCIETNLYKCYNIKKKTVTLHFEILKIGKIYESQESVKV
jgi:hypothetical protein